MSALLAGSGVQTLLVLGIALVGGALLLLVLRRLPRTAVAVWLVALSLVPVWSGVQVGGYYLPPSTIAAVLVILAIVPVPGFRVSPLDALVVLMTAAGFAGVVVGGGAGVGMSTLVTFLTYALPGYLLGRLAAHRIGMASLHALVAVVSTVVAVLAVVEFVSGWNPFVLLPGNAGLRETWATLQGRGGIIRAEGAYGHSIALGSALAIAIPLTLASRFRLPVRLGMTAVMMLAAVLTFSRVGMLGAVLGLALSIVFLRDAISLRVRATVTAGVVVVAAAVAPSCRACSTTPAPRRATAPTTAATSTASCPAWGSSAPRPMPTAAATAASSTARSAPSTASSCSRASPSACSSRPPCSSPSPWASASCCAAAPPRRPSRSSRRSRRSRRSRSSPSTRPSCGSSRGWRRPARSSAATPGRSSRRRRIPCRRASRRPRPTTTTTPIPPTPRSPPAPAPSPPAPPPSRLYPREPPMTLHEFTALLRRLWYVVVAATLVGGGIAFGLSQLATPVYTAQSRLYFSLSSGSSASDLNQGATYTQSQMLSFGEPRGVARGARARDHAPRPRPDPAGARARRERHDAAEHRDHGDQRHRGVARRCGRDRERRRDEPARHGRGVRAEGRRGLAHRLRPRDPGGA
ncbi:hypothetical protein [Clavibacter tessellarius]|uniref:hypothetical protein n=1 Tax=Clavibacter tessellarius TaxID=31965 RepID=UPI0032524F78